MKSLSLLIIRRRRLPGFTLLEVLLAVAIGMGLMAIVANAYLGANKAQSISVATGLMKSSGQTGMNDIYQNLHQSHLIFGRNSVGTSFLSRLPIKGYDASATALEPGVNTSDIVLPEVKSSGEFWEQDATGTINPDFSKAAVGNTLFFISTGAKAVMQEESGSTALNDTFGKSEVHFTPYQIHFYYLARRPLPTGGKLVRPGSAYTYQLMYWRSRWYLDYNEVVSWMRKLKANVMVPSVDTYITNKLKKLRSPDSPGTPAGTGSFMGALDLTQTNGSLTGSPPVLYNLTADTATYLNLLPNTTSRFATDHLRHAFKYTMKDGFGETMVAFNTTAPSPNPVVKVPGLDVPRYGDHTTLQPYGIEVMIVGEPSHRQVLLRMALAARTNPGSNMVGQTFQQVIQIYADSPEAVGTPAPTAVPSGSAS